MAEPEMVQPNRPGQPFWNRHGLQRKIAIADLTNTRLFVTRDNLLIRSPPYQITTQVQVRMAYFEISDITTAPSTPEKKINWSRVSAEAD